MLEFTCKQFHTFCSCATFMFLVSFHTLFLLSSCLFLDWLTVHYPLLILYQKGFINTLHQVSSHTHTHIGFTCYVWEHSTFYRHNDFYTVQTVYSIPYTSVHLQYSILHNVGFRPHTCWGFMGTFLTCFM